jgi:uncharacterized damage-inducible protein DinB
MGVRETLLPEFDQEMAATRQVLARVPEASFAWRPHERSHAMGGLATHLAQIPYWGCSILTRDGYDLATAGTAVEALPTLAAVLERFDRHVGEVRRALVEMGDAQLQTTWSLRRGTHLILSMPRIAALRRFVLHHTIHHRGQLTVYLRLQGVALPPLYGPSADESM